MDKKLLRVKGRRKIMEKKIENFCALVFAFL